MTQIKLFGVETAKIVKNMPVDMPVEETEVRIEAINLKKPKKSRKEKEFYEQHSEEELKNMIKDEKIRLDELEKQDETGWTDMDKMYRGKESNIKLVKNHIQYYETALDRKQGGNKWKMHECVNCGQEYEEFKEKDVKNFIYNTCKDCCKVEEREKYVYLNNWRDFIVNLCKAKGEIGEIDKIWYDYSAPYDCEMEVRLKGHRCWNSCVSFRFEKGKLCAYDSHFGGGTTGVEPYSALRTQTQTQEMVDMTSCLTKEEFKKWEEQIITEVMNKVFAKECSNSSWEDSEKDRGHRDIIIDEKGWIIK